MLEEGKAGPLGARKMESLRPALPRLDLVARETRFPTWFPGYSDFLPPEAFGLLVFPIRIFAGKNNGSHD